MRWLLDTNAWIRYLNPASSDVKARLRTHNPEEIVLCDVVKAELYFGAYNSGRRDQNLQILAELFGVFHSLPLDGDAARIYGQVRVDLQRTGRLIGPYDLFIAAIVLANDVTLVTHNTSEFVRIEALKLEDWEESSFPK